MSAFEGTKKVSADILFIQEPYVGGIYLLTQFMRFVGEQWENGKNIK